MKIARPYFIQRCQSSIKSVLAGLTIFLSASVILQPAGSASRAQQTPAVSGTRLFALNCSSSYCHGRGGSGGGAPKLRDRTFTMEYLRRVIGRGIPGTAMPAFRFRMQPAEIEQLSAYVFAISRGEAVEEESDAPAPSAPKEAPAGPAASPALGRGDAAAGKELFFSATVIENCRVCHTFQGRGGKVGPDLTPLAVRTPRELYRSIVEPSSVINPDYPTISVTLRDGSRIAGVRRDEDALSLRLYDTSTMPPVSRAILKSEIARREPLPSSGMPSHYAKLLSPQQLLDLIAFLKSADPQALNGVTQKDVN